MRDFKWIPWNRAKIEKHGVDIQEVESVVNRARRPYPRLIDNDKFLVWGQTNAGRYLQVIYVVEEDDRTFVIHARPLDDIEKRRLRRSRR